MPPCHTRLPRVGGWVGRWCCVLPSQFILTAPPPLPHTAHLPHPTCPGDGLPSLADAAYLGTDTARHNTAATTGKRAAGCYLAHWPLQAGLFLHRRHSAQQRATTAPYAACAALTGNAAGCLPPPPLAGLPRAQPPPSPPHTPQWVFH